jgi:hypothetical protein
MLGIVLLAANLRSALTSVAPLIGQIRTDTGISNGVAGLLTILPLLAFGVLSPIVPWVARRFGMERMLLASLLVLAAGIMLRSGGGVGAVPGHSDLGSSDHGRQRALALPRQAGVPPTRWPHDERVLHRIGHQRHTSGRRERACSSASRRRVAGRFSLVGTPCCHRRRCVAPPAPPQRSSRERVRPSLL